MKRRQFLLSVPISYLAATNEVLATDNSIGNLEVQQDPVPLVLTSGPDYDKANFIGNELWAYKKPAFVVRAKTAADVAFAITLAKKHKIPFSVKGGGHSYAGYCLNQGGVMLDMSLMDQVEVDAKSMTVKIGGGTRWLAVYEALTKVNRDFIVMGGICPTVGVCGYIMGGGMNIASRSLGLGIDSLEALTIMTADGVIHELSSSQALSENLKDLWWAVRGGGGGNFGIVLSITLKIVILKTLTIGSLSWNERAKFEEAVPTVYKTLKRETAIDAVWTKAGPGEQTKGSMTVCHIGELQSCRVALSSIFVPRLTPSKDTLAQQVFADWDESNDRNPFTPNTFFYHVAFIFGPGQITEGLVEIISELMTAAPSRSSFHWNHVGGACSDVAPEATAYYWRDGEYAATAKIYWHDASDTAVCMAWAQRVKDKLSPFAVEGKATYINYIEKPFDGWQEAYYGKNYPRLRRVKSKFDKENFFQFPLGIELN